MPSEARTTVTGNGDTTFNTVPGVWYAVIVEDAGGTAEVTVKNHNGDSYTGSALAEGESDLFLASGNTITCTTASHSADFAIDLVSHIQ